MARLRTLGPRVGTLDTRLARAVTKPGATANQRYEAQRRRDSSTIGLYGTGRWKRIRADQLAREPLCAMCLAEGVTTEATVCDHTDPHRGDVEAFWRGPFVSLCGHHHSSAKQREENALR